MNKILTGLVTGGVILTTTAGALAFTGNIDGPGNMQRQGNDQKRQEVMAAIEAEDYETWSQLVAEGPKGEEILAIINENNFSQLVEAHNLMESGDKEAGRAIMDELGLSDVLKFQEGSGDRQEVMEAIKNGDYETWKSIIETREYGPDLLNLVDETTFNSISQILEYVHNDENGYGRGMMGDLGFGGGRRGHMGEMNNADDISSDTV